MTAAAPDPPRRDQEERETRSSAKVLAWLDEGWQLLGTRLEEGQLVWRLAPPEPPPSWEQGPPRS